MSARVLDWPGSRNARDLGGLPTRGGGHTRHGVLLRSESPHRLGKAGLAAMEAHGLALLLDLRSDVELEEAPHPLGGHPAYRRIPWVDDAREFERDATSETTMADLYRGSLERNTAQIGRVMRAVVGADGPVLVHCMGGKDRTGMLVAMLLELAGVPRPVIAQDYAVSEVNLGTLARIEAMSRQERERRRADVLWRTRPETILETLAYLTDQRGGVRDYLRGCGVPGDELAGFVTRFTAP